MRYALAVSGAALLFGLGFVLAACGSSTPASTETTFTPGPKGSSVHVLYTGPMTTKTTVATIGYLDTDGSESTVTLTYTTTEPRSGRLGVSRPELRVQKAVTFTEISSP